MDTSAIVSVERVEREAWLDLFSIAPPEVINSLGIRWTHLPAATVFAAREAPLVEFNRALGLGLEQPVTEEDLEAVTAWLRAHGNSASALQLAPLVLSEVVLDWMHKTDLEAAGAGWTKFWRGTSPVPDHPSLGDPCATFGGAQRRSRLWCGSPGWIWCAAAVCYLVLRAGRSTEMEDISCL
jgi:hypothetical protein